MANEKRLIDANAFWKSVSTDYWEHFTQCHTTDQIDLMEMVEENLAEQPTVDAVEVKHGYDKGYADGERDAVVLCKNCQFGIPNETNGKYNCKSNMGLNRLVHPNEFCSWGTKRMGGD